jgi:predicted aspartyl protease
MGSFRVPLEVGKPVNGEGRENAATESVTALVDTGATFSMIPASVLERLGIVADDTVLVRIATHDVVEFPVGEASFSAEGRRRRTSPVIFGPENHYIMGAMALESLLLTVDPVNERLVPYISYL